MQIILATGYGTLRVVSDRKALPFESLFSFPYLLYDSIYPRSKCNFLNTSGQIWFLSYMNILDHFIVV